MEASKYYNMNRYNIKILNFVNTSEKIRINNKQSILNAKGLLSTFTFEGLQRIERSRKVVVCYFIFFMLIFFSIALPYFFFLQFSYTSNSVVVAVGSLVSVHGQSQFDS